MPTYHELMLPTLRAVEALGGSGSAKEIREQVVADLEPADALLEVEYDSESPKGVYRDRLDWARSYCKLGGALESPRRNLFLITGLGREVLALPDSDALERLRDIDSDVRGRREAEKKSVGRPESSDEGIPDEDEGDWEEALLARLHRLSPDAFEEFVLYLLRSYGLELTRVGGTGDEGIDGIGLAPLSPVLSATVAVQAKRYDPATSIGREKVALFQRDAAAAGAERAVMVTLGRFTEPARKAGTTTTPTVDLIDGERVAALVREQELGVRLLPVVLEDWFDRFED